MADFDMPPEGTWEERGGWVVGALVRDLNLTPEQAAGFVGNPGYESYGFTKLQEIRPIVAGSAGGYGWAQWTAARRRQYMAYCDKHQLDPASDEANYGFLVEELKTSYSWFLARLRATDSIVEACKLTHAWYERPQDVLDGSYKSGADRLKWANRALSGFKRAGEGGTAPPVHDYPILENGDQGAPVRALQTILNGVLLAVDGEFGSQTEYRVMAFQVGHGLEPDGIVGPATWAALEKYRKDG